MAKNAMGVGSYRWKIDLSTEERKRRFFMSVGGWPTDL